MELPVVALKIYPYEESSLTLQGTQIKGKSLEKSHTRQNATFHWSSLLGSQPAAMQHDILGILNWIQATMYDLDLNDHRHFFYGLFKINKSNLSFTLFHHSHRFSFLSSPSYCKCLRTL